MGFSRLGNDVVWSFRGHKAPLCVNFAYYPRGLTKRAPVIFLILLAAKKKKIDHPLKSEIEADIKIRRAKAKRISAEKKKSSRKKIGGVDEEFR